MDLRDYLARTGLDVPAAAVREAQTAIWAIMDEAKKASLPATPSALNRLYQFKVPKLSPDGSCSLHDELDPTPYDLAKVLGGRDVRTSMQLLFLDSLVDESAKKLGVDWLGIYQARQVASGRALVKLAYHGVESRAEFPLTEAFAKKSTNAAVGLSGKPRVLQDVRAHVAGGGEYYECDPKVLSEACLPLFDDKGQLAGVIDAESRSANTFDGTRLGWLVALALETPSHLPNR